MYVFSRRAIQRCIDDLDGVLRPEQVADLVARLNRPGSDRLAATWEAVLLNGLAGLGTLSHEVSLGGTKKPDVTFAYPGHNQPGFVADVTTISDEGLHHRNPIFQFSQALSALASRVGLNANHFHFDVKGITTGPFGYRRTILLLPPENQIDQFINTHVLPFVRLIKNLKLTQHDLFIDQEAARIVLTYDSRRMYGGGSYPSYNIPQSPKNNPLWNRLRQKVSQVSVDHPQILTGIIACDGGSHLLHSQTRSRDTFTSAEVVQTFLREFPTIDFVMLIGIDILENIKHGKDYT